MQTTKIGDREFSIVGIVTLPEFGTLPVLDIPMMDEQVREQREAEAV